MISSSNKKSVKLRELVEKIGYFKELPKHNFKQSATGMKYCKCGDNKE